MTHVVSLLLIALLTSGCSINKNITPIRMVVDLNVGESRQVTLSNGTTVNLNLIGINSTVDNLNSAVGHAQAEIQVDDKIVFLDVANYNLPLTTGNVQIDCPITKAYTLNSSHSRWKLEKDARFRLWPAGSPYISPNTFSYPLNQKILANSTQMDNEPTFVDGGEIPGKNDIYYHSALDFGGLECKEVVYSPVNGKVIVAGRNILDEYKDSLSKPTYDEVYILDNRGWRHGFFNLYSIDSTVVPGAIVKMGQKIGLLGKEGASGGWAHLHYTIKSPQPSGKYGEENAYPYIWEAYVKKYKPKIIAVARPHKFVAPGETVFLDGHKSKSFDGDITDYKWLFSDGSTAKGVRQKRSYSLPGTYSEVLKVTDSKGNIDYDYTELQVANKEEPDKLPPTIHAVYYPTLGIKAGDPVIFGVRTFRTKSGEEVWNFGDGSDNVKVKSVIPELKREGEYATVIHKFEKPGDYLVRVERTGEYGYKAIAHLHIEVED